MALVELNTIDLTPFGAVLSVKYLTITNRRREGVYRHYKAIAEASPIPVILYNVPGRTGVNMTAETTLRLAREFGNIIGVKEASGNINQMDDIIKTSLPTSW